MQRGAIEVISLGGIVIIVADSADLRSSCSSPGAARRPRSAIGVSGLRSGRTPCRVRRLLPRPPPRTLRSSAGGSSNISSSSTASIGATTAGSSSSSGMVDRAIRPSSLYGRRPLREGPSAAASSADIFAARRWLGATIEKIAIPASSSRRRRRTTTSAAAKTTAALSRREGQANTESFHLEVESSQLQLLLA